MIADVTRLLQDAALARQGWSAVYARALAESFVREEVDLPSAAGPCQSLGTFPPTRNRAQLSAFL